MCGIVTHGAGADARGVNVRRPCDDRGSFRESQLLGSNVGQSSDHFGRVAQGRHVLTIESCVGQENVVVVDGVRIAVVGDPVQHDRIVRRNGPTGES